MFVLGLKNHIRDNLFVLNTAKQENIPVYTIQNNSQTQITQILSTFEDLLLLESTFSGFCKKILKLPFSSKVRTCNLGC